MNTDHKKRLMIDFDGVIHKYSQGWLDGAIYDAPVEGAKEKLAMLVKGGYEVVIFTTRVKDNGHDSIFNWLHKNGMHIDTHYHHITDTKQPALAYIDDRAVRFTSWEDTVKYFI